MSLAVEIGKWFKKRPMPRINDYLDPGCILFLEEQDRDGALRKLVDLLYAQGKIEKIEEFYQAILEREKIVSTGVGMGVAIPHAKLKGLNDFFIAVGVQQRGGLEWNSLDKAPVNLIFMIGGPDGRQAEYLQILSRLTFAIKDKNLRKKIFSLNDPHALFALLEQF